MNETEVPSENASKAARELIIAMQDKNIFVDPRLLIPLFENHFENALRKERNKQREDDARLLETMQPEYKMIPDCSYPVPQMNKCLYLPSKEELAQRIRKTIEPEN